ncbi:MAG: hypothetical protein HOK52_12945 [Candidatus Marinimicrobia bacterium]|jgi:hypothetical protein|nr:hypothetical protein [Candidatus Neomarinimicrobiota bacterium]
MSRPSPTIISEYTNTETYHSTQVLEAESIVAVYYDAKPINIKVINSMAYSIPKYKKVSFSNSGHAINLAKKLNKQFGTTKFTVVKLSHDETIFSE